MPKSIQPQAIGQRFINPDGTPTSEFYTFYTLVAQLEVLDDENSPEGVVFAPYKAQYWDTVNEQLYFKTTTEKDNTGWILIGP